MSPPLVVAASAPLWGSNVILNLFYVTPLPLLLFPHSYLVFPYGSLILLHVSTQFSKRSFPLIPIALERKIYPLRHLRDLILRQLYRLLCMLSSSLHPLLGDGLVLPIERSPFMTIPNREIFLVWGFSATLYNSWGITSCTSTSVPIMMQWIMMALSTVTSDRLLVGMMDLWMNSNHPLAMGFRSALLSWMGLP